MLGFGVGPNQTSIRLARKTNPMGNLNLIRAGLHTVYFKYLDQCEGHPMEALRKKNKITLIGRTL